MKAFKFILVILSVFLFGYLQNNAQSVISRQSKAKTTATEKKHVSSQKNVSKKSKKLGSNSQTNKNKSKAQPITISAPDGYINGHGYVNLGLPSGTKWATCNIGANSPQNDGNYYAWGETSINSNYTISACRAYDIDELTKSSKALTEKMCEGNNLKPSHDAARVNWGSLWEMPTCAQITELIEKCIWTWITYKGNKGYRVVGPNGKSIFLPAAGFKSGTSLEWYNELGDYLSSTFNGRCNVTLKFDSINAPHCFMHSSFRSNGSSVRPVHP